MSFSTPWEKSVTFHTLGHGCLILSRALMSTFFFRKGAADTLVNAYLSIYFAYTPFYGSLTLYE